MSNYRDDAKEDLNLRGEYHFTTDKSSYDSVKIDKAINALDKQIDESLGQTYSGGRYKSTMPKDFKSIPLINKIRKTFNKYFYWLG